MNVLFASQVRWVYLVFAVVSVASLGGHLAEAQSITEFPIPISAASTPTGIVSGPDGFLWFTDLNANNICRLSTRGDLTVFPLPGLNGGSYGIAAGPDGALWFTEGIARIGRLTTDGRLTEFPLSDSFGVRPGIVTGPDGALWFTDAGTVARIGRITTSGAITEFPLPTVVAFPASIVAGPDGALWFTEAGASKIGRIMPSGMISEFATPTPDSQPWGITAGPDGALWFGERHAIGRITTSGVVTEYPLPGPVVNTLVDGIAPGADGALWFTERNASKIGRITTQGAIQEFPLPGIRDPLGITLGSDGALWFTEFSGGRIGRIAPEGACTFDSTSLCLNAGRFRVRADWRVPSQGTSGHGTASALTGDTGYFWFFSPGNVEMVVKVVRGCSFNDRYWVFAGGLTNVEVTLTVQDMDTGEVKTYVNPADTAFQPIQDTTAFASCR